MSNRNSSNPGGFASDRRQTRSQPAVRPGSIPEPGRSPNSDPRFTFNNDELKVMGLLILSSWLSDDRMREAYNTRLKAVTNNNINAVQALLEKIIEATEKGFMLATPPFLLSPNLLAKFTHGRKSTAEDYDRLNQLFIVKYFNLDEAPGDSIMRMLVDEGVISKDAVPTPVDLQLAMNDRATSAAQIIAVDTIVKTDYNDTVAGHANAFSMNTRYSSILDRLIFIEYKKIDGNHVTEWHISDSNTMVRVTTQVKRTYRNGDSVVRYDIIDFTLGE